MGDLILGTASTRALKIGKVLFRSLMIEFISYRGIQKVHCTKNVLLS